MALSSPTDFDFTPLRELAERFGNVVKGRIEREYDLVRPHFAEVPAVLDIGCGIGFMDILLARHHGTRHINLLDGDGSGVKKLGYNDEDTTPWNDVLIGSAFVQANVADDVTVTSYFWGDPSWPEHVDLVMSLWSWGFHYPASTYVAQVSERYPEADVMVDLRCNTEGAAPFYAAGYRERALVEKNNKAHRVIFKR
jgi:hypothetical protein